MTASLSLNEVRQSLPSELAALIADRTWTQVAIGRSHASTYRLTGHEDACYLPTCYLKLLRGFPRHDLKREAQVIEWLQGKLPAPAPLWWGVDGDCEYLLMSAVPGRDAVAMSESMDATQLAHLLGDALRMVHDVSVIGCPFDRTLTVELDVARFHVDHGLVDEDDFEDEWLGCTADEVYRTLVEQRPASDLVFVHGDYTLPNVIIDNGRVSGFVDLGRAGIGDRYKDLAIASWSIHHNLGGECVPAFFRAYGIETPDTGKLHYYTMLDELM